MKTTRTGKIARLPHTIREQLNRRLQDNHQAKPILKWLNALPKVRAVLVAEFDGHAISPQNLSEWKRGGFRDWQVRMDVLQLAKSLEDEHAFGQKSIKAPFTDKLAHWLTLRYAAAAHALATTDRDPKAQWNRLRELSADVTRLRGGDLHAERLRLEREWLAFEKSTAEQRTEKLFWAWTKRPHIKEKLMPPSKMGLSPEGRRQVEYDLCLMGDNAAEIAELMRERREREEAEMKKPSGNPPESSPIKPNKA